MTPDGKERYEHTEVGTDPVKLGNRVSEILKEYHSVLYSFAS
jgi:hydroxymethylbilane synthase